MRVLHALPQLRITYVGSAASRRAIPHGTPAGELCEIPFAFRL